MAKLDWGRGIGLHFKNNNEYYETLGFLTKRSRLVDIYTHDNGRSGAYRSDIDNLVNRRNTIAHGSRTDGVADTEYVRWESSTKSVMENIVRKIYFYANNEKYLRTENES